MSDQTLEYGEPLKLRPYHNPQNADTSIIPQGWRLLYEDEAGKHQAFPVRRYYKQDNRFSDFRGYSGNIVSYTYIVPVHHEIY